MKCSTSECGVRVSKSCTGDSSRCVNSSERYVSICFLLYYPKKMKPLVIALSLEKIEEMDDDELDKCLAEFDP